MQSVYFETAMTYQYYAKYVKAREYYNKILSLLKGIDKFSGTIELRAIMPGNIIKILRNVRDSVKENETVIVLEAMKMEKPILTSNYSFAADICGDAALYFDPLDAKDIAEKILKLKDDKKLYDELIKIGKERLKDFEASRSRAEKYLEICEKIKE